MNTNQNLFRSVFMKGVRWSFLSTVFLSLSGILYYAVLARFLTPADFGLFSVGLIFTGFLDFFAGAGISAVIIQEKKVTSEQYSTFFWINLIVGLSLSLLLILFAPFISTFFQEIHLRKILYILSATVLLNAFSLLHNNILRKELQIADTEKIEMFATISQIGTGVLLAINGFSIYSLPLAFFVGKVISGFGYLWLGKKYFWPSFTFCYQSVKPQLKLGTFQVLERFFNYLRANSDKFLIGKFLGTSDLGYYTLAQKLIEFPLSKINPALNKILFPYFSRLQNRPKIISKLYVNVTTFLMIAVSPFLIFVLFFAKDIVDIILGENYHNIAPLVQILSVLGLLRSFSNIGGNLLLSIGKFQVGVIWNFWWSIIISVIIYIGLSYQADLIDITYIIFWANFVSFFLWQTIIYSNLPFSVILLTGRLLLSLLFSFIISYLFYFCNPHVSEIFSQKIRMIFYLLLITLLVFYTLKKIYFNNKRNMIHKWK